MAKQTWVKIFGEWKEIKSMWMRIGGTWKEDVMPYVRVSGVWKECMSYVEPIPSNANIGDDFGGGKVAYIGSEFPVMGGMICHSDVGWDYDTTTRQWGCRGTTVGLDGTLLGTGYANTEAAVTHACNMESDKAPRICWDTDTGGYTDWFLPSLNELNELYLNKSTLDGFAADWYWSSSESSSRFARFRSFTYGFQYLSFKSSAYKLRAVRGF